MKTFRVSALLLLVMLAAGCANPVERAYTTRSLFNEGVKDANAAMENKLITKEQFKPIVAAEDVMVPVLDELDRSALKGESFDFEKTYGNTRTQVRDFLIQVLSAKQKGKL